MITARNISKSFGDLRILKGLDFESNKAEVVSIMGASGAGKSTLLQVLGSLMTPDSGEIIIDNINLASLSEVELSDFRNKKIGFVFQAHHLLPEFSALENVMLPGLIGKRDKSLVEEEAKILLTDLGLADRLEHKPSELSGGEQQRVAIARSLINKPSVLFADEPSGNLDSSKKEEIHRLFLELRDKYSISVIIVTHDNDLAQMSDRMLVMTDGQFISL